MTDVETLYAGDIPVYVTTEHRFGTDAVALADFAAESLRGKRNVKVCDLCTGCGIVAVMLARFPNTQIHAVDISREAISLLQRTSYENNLNIHILCEDLKNIKKLGNEYADMVTVNPPYFRAGSGFVPSESSRHAARHEFLCNLDDVSRAAAYVLKYGGVIKMCIIPDRLADAVCALRENSLEMKKLKLLTHESKNKPWLCLIEAKKGGKPGMRIEV